VYYLEYNYRMRLIEKTDDYENWFTSIKDRLVKARIQVRVDRLIEGNAGDTAPVGEGVNELAGLLHRAWTQAHHLASRRQQKHPKQRHLKSNCIGTQPLGLHHDKNKNHPL
jgi:hypothetical protein